MTIICAGSCELKEAIDEQHHKVVTYCSHALTAFIFFLTGVMTISCARNSEVKIKPIIMLGGALFSIAGGEKIGSTVEQSQSLNMDSQYSQENLDTDVIGSSEHIESDLS